MNLVIESERARFARTSRDDRSCPRSTQYAVLLPDANAEMFRENGGLVITDFGASDGCARAVKLEDGHYALIYRDLDYKTLRATGPYIVDTSDNPAVTFAIWHATDMPMPCRMAERGRMVWSVPGTGKVYLYYNQKKEDMYYEPDHLGKDGKTRLVKRFGGYPIVLELQDRTPFSLNSFLADNRLYTLGDCKIRTGGFVDFFLGNMAELTRDECESRWNHEIDPNDVIKRINLLAVDLQVPVRLARQGGDGIYRWEGPLAG